MALVKPDTIDCFNFHEESVRPFFFIFPWLYVHFLVMGAVCFFIFSPLFYFCFPSLDMLTQLLFSFPLFLFPFFLKSIPLGGSLVDDMVTTKVPFLPLLWRTDKTTWFIMRATAGLANSNFRKLFAFSGLSAKRSSQRYIGVLLVHNWTRIVYDWRLPRCWSLVIIY